MGCFVSMRKFLDKLYLHSAHLASFFLLLVLTIIVTQMLTRWTGFTFPGATAYAGYAMAGSAFFALAHTLNEDGHIRVKILLHRLGGKTHRMRWSSGVVHAGRNSRSCIGT